MSLKPGVKVVDGHGQLFRSESGLRVGDQFGPPSKPSIKALTFATLSYQIHPTFIPLPPRILGIQSSRSAAALKFLGEVSIILHR
jgi:hypothetical protein